MPTFFRWIVAVPVAIAFISPAVANPVLPSPGANSVVALPGPNAPFCFMVNSSGELVDLTSLCGNSTAEAILAAPLQAGGAAATPPQGANSAFPQAVAQSGRPCYFLDSNGDPCQ
ncbi:MAG: hypothetical protein WBG38_11935 [Nodosilinea sp.]